MPKFYVEEADMLCGVSGLFGKLCLTVGSIEQAQVEGY